MAPALQVAYGRQEVGHSLVMAWLPHIDPTLGCSPTFRPLERRNPVFYPFSAPLAREGSNSFVLGIVRSENGELERPGFVATCSLSPHQHGTVLIGRDDADRFNLRTLATLSTSGLLGQAAQVDV